MQHYIYIYIYIYIDLTLNATVVTHLLLLNISRHFLFLISYISLYIYNIYNDITNTTHRSTLVLIFVIIHLTSKQWKYKSKCCQFACHCARQVHDHAAVIQKDGVPKMVDIKYFQMLIFSLSLRWYACVDVLTALTG